MSKIGRRWTIGDWFEIGAFPPQHGSGSNGLGLHWGAAFAQPARQFRWTLMRVTSLFFRAHRKISRPPISPPAMTWLTDLQYLHDHHCMQQARGSRSYVCKSQNTITQPDDKQGGDPNTHTATGPCKQFVCFSCCTGSTFHVALSFVLGVTGVLTRLALPLAVPARHVSLVTAPHSPFPDLVMNNYQYRTHTISVRGRAL